jgi:hypothetical protein
VLVGDIQADGDSGHAAKRNVRLVSASNGLLKVWQMPERGGEVKVRYCVVVDVGGRSEKSDYSVIAVWRVAMPSRRAAIVAQWRGHIDHDELGWKSMQLALYYNNAPLVVESNTLTNEAARAGESEYILENVHRCYGWVYKRDGRNLGFHTNVKTKREAITALIRAVRLGTYEERDIEAVCEMRNYQFFNGRYEARAGKHDDILMTRAIGLLVMEDESIKGGDQERQPDRSLAMDNWMAERLSPNRH